MSLLRDLNSHPPSPTSKNPPPPQQRPPCLAHCSHNVDLIVRLALGLGLGLGAVWFVHNRRFSTRMFSYLCMHARRYNAHSNSNNNYNNNDNNCVYEHLKNFHCNLSLCFIYYLVLLPFACPV